MSKTKAATFENKTQKIDQTESYLQSSLALETKKLSTTGQT
jgi:hypothetical protein